MFYEMRDLIRWGSRKSTPAEWMAGCHLVAADAQGSPAESPSRNSGSRIEAMGLEERRWVRRRFMRKNP